MDSSVASSADVPEDLFDDVVNDLIESGDSAILWSSDTGPTFRFWEVANQTPNLKAVCIETSFDDSMQEIGVPNIVTSVLASYRAYDTFGEVVVIFTAGIGVLSLLSWARRSGYTKDDEAYNQSMHEQHLILRIVIKMMIPFILLFALYVQFHGDFGPGGGFQAGVIFASAIFLYTMLFGMSTARRVISQPFIQILAATGVLLYGSVGVASLLNGKNFLDYSALSSDPVAGQHLGILLIEMGVGLTVTSTMIIIFFNFASRRNNLQRKENQDI